MTRVCKLCGKEYRGLVCQFCHPRHKKRPAPTGVVAVDVPEPTPPQAKAENGQGA